METTLTDAQLRQLSEDERRHFERARSVSSWMDDKFKIFGFGVGLDGLIGLVPVVGDTVSAGFGLYHLSLAKKLGLGTGTQARIVWNLIIDYLVGLVPQVGDFLDFGYRSHRKNMRLIEKQLAKRLEGRDGHSTTGSHGDPLPEH